MAVQKSAEEYENKKDRLDSTDHHRSMAGYSDVKERALPGMPEAGRKIRRTYKLCYRRSYILVKDFL